MSIWSVRSARGLFLKFRSTWALAAIGLVIANFAAVAAAEQAIITTTDGNQIEGELISEDDEQVVIRISGIRTTLPRDRVASIEIQPSIEEVYRERRAELDDDDLDGRYDLAYDLYRQNALDLALRELADMVERFPDSERVIRLQRVVEQRREMLEQRESETDRPDRRPSRRVRPDEPMRDEPADRLTADQINRIRVYEIDLAAEPRIQIPDPVLEEFLQRYAADDRVPSDREGQAAFKRADAVQQLELMFTVQAREFYDQVIVRQDPPVLRDFRTQMHNQYVLNYCGTNQCHGGDDAPGGLRVLHRRPMSVATVYTNFYLLHTYQNEQGRMIQRGEAERSLLLQYGLPREMAEVPHPEVAGWSPRFTGVDDRFFQRYAAILERLWTPAPDYGIDFQPDWLPPAPMEDGASGATSDSAPESN